MQYAQKLNKQKFRLVAYMKFTNNINLSHADDCFWSQNMISRANVVFYRNEK